MHTINSLNVKDSRVKKVTKIEPFFLHLKKALFLLSSFYIRIKTVLK